MLTTISLFSLNTHNGKYIREILKILHDIFHQGCGIMRQDQQHKSLYIVLYISHSIRILSNFTYVHTHKNNYKRIIIFIVYCISFGEFYSEKGNL